MPQHQLAHINVSNFRSCQSLDLELRDFTPLVGNNNTGKSTILRAIEWLIRPSSLVREDFCDPDQPVVVEGRVEGIGENILGQLESTHRARMTELCTDESMWFRRVQAEPGVSAKSIGLEVRETAQGADWRKAPTGIPQAI